MSRLSHILEVREIHLSNLESCTISSKKLVDLLRVTDDEALGGGAPPLQPFDHSLCHDCAYVETITSDCVAHLQKLTQQTAESSQKLLWLVELREKVRESGEFLINLEKEIVESTAATEDFTTANAVAHAAATVSNGPVTEYIGDSQDSDTSVPKDYI